MVSGCVTTRLLQENEYLLGKQQIKGTQKVSKRVLAAYFQQRPNATWLGLPWKLWAYHFGQRSFDREAIRQRIAQIEAEFSVKKAKAACDPEKVQRLEKKRAKKIQAQNKLLQEGNVLIQRGEAPVIYSPQQRQLTEQNLMEYLQSKGFFEAQVSSAVKFHNQRASITYHIQENHVYLIKSLRLRTADQAIEKLLQAHQRQSLLRQGAPYDQKVLWQERERIYELLGNHGYFSFDRQYIWFEVDKTAADHTVSIETVIGVPADSPSHPVYHVDQVVWDVDAGQPEEAGQAEFQTCSNIMFRNLRPHFNPRVLAKKLPLQLPQLYRKKDLIETQQRLARLGMFKYVNITYDMVSPGRLVPHIYTAPVDRFQLTSELGLQVSHSLPTPFYKVSLASKSLFRRLETLKLAAHIGVEGVAATTSAKRLTNSQALGIDVSLSWPQFLLPLRDTARTRLEAFSPQTSLSIGYDLTHRPTFTQDTLKTLLRYTWQDHKYGTYEWIPLRMDLIATRSMSDQFAKKLQERQSNLYRSFQPSWLTLFSFKSTFRKHLSLITDPSYWALELFFESGGTLQNLIDLRSIMPQLTYYQYAKLNGTYSQHIPVFANTIFAYRIGAGVALPYGENQLLPYNRYYFMGGTNDMRAWYPRSLGPGTSYAHGRYDSEQPGECLLQGSVELRQPLVGVLEGALFVDAGNIWTLREDGRPGGRLSWPDFYKAIAVGTGVGARLNFRLLVLRLDMGIKLYDPSRPAGERFIGRKIALNKHLGLPGQAVFNLGIGYPF